jgi:3-oxoacyl-(acyl-carrier-protein) synthase III
MVGGSTFDRTLATMTTAVIEGVGHAVPRRSMSTDEVAARVSASSGFRLDPRVIVGLSGVEERRCAGPDEMPSFLASAACRRALADAGRRAEEVDLVINASISQDSSEPATAALIQERVGCSGSAAFDVKNGCNGFLSALELARVLIEAGAHRLALVVAAEVLTPVTAWSLQDSRELATWFATYTFGDAGAACVVGGRGGGTRRIGPGVFESDGRHWRLCTTTREDDRFVVTTHSIELERMASERVPKLVDQVLEREGWPGDTVDLCVPHQASVPGLARTSEMLSIPLDRCVVTTTRFGNTAAASMPLALSVAKATGRLHRGARVLLVGAASGFSAGVTPVVW